MQTDDLIGMLAQGAGAVEPAGDGRRMGLGAALALPVMVAAVALTLGLVPMSDWPVSSTVPKLCYALVLMVVVGRPLVVPPARLSLPPSPSTRIRISNSGASPSATSSRAATAPPRSRPAR